MPLKLTQYNDPAVLNKWADGIEQQLNSLKIPVPLKTNLPSFLTNNVSNNMQNVLNLIAGTGITITTDPVGHTVISAVSTGDGLIHGTSPWESDPSYVSWRDDFHGAMAGTFASSTNPVVAIGELGWALTGVVGADSVGYLGGQPPSVGLYGWSNNNVAQDAGWLTFNSSGPLTNNNHLQNSFALGERPNWAMSFIWKVEGDLTSLGAFSTAQKAIYIGLTDPSFYQLTTDPISRPNTFIGIRFDTSTSAPSINDSFYTLEVVSNQTFNTVGRNNTQGTKKVTNVAPIPGQIHRLDILCNAAGMITLTLDGSSLNTLTAAIPMQTVSVSATGSLQNNMGHMSWSTSATNAQSPWNTGSSVTVAGYTGAQTALNGTQILASSTDGVITFDLNGSTVAGSNQAITMAGYPSLTPIFAMGNDDTAAPTANNMMMLVDYFSFVWNPGVGGGTGTPSITLPRYF